jgi:ATP-dependent RNA helicase DDX27
MLEEAFLEQMKEVVRSCARTRQTLLFSATMTEQVEQLATVSLNKPVKVFVDSNKVVAWNLRQEFVRVRAGREEEREALLAALVCRTFRDHTMVFIQTKAQCHRLHIVLGLLGVRVGELHGNMSQPQRMDTLQRFKEEQLDVMLATDVAARGLDIRGVKTVINFTMPTTLEHYIHRVGRTARAGRAGRSVSLAGEGERKMVREIVKRARDPVKSRAVNADVLVKYRSRLTKLEEDVALVLEEEKADRELAKCENRAGKLHNKLNGVDDDRAWFQTKQQRKDEKQALKKKMTDPTFTKQKQKRKAAQANLDPAEAKEMKGMNNEAEYLARGAKKARQQKKIRTIVDDPEKSGTGKVKQKKKSSFDSELTNTSDRSVKQFRHIANKRKSDDKRMNKKKPKGGGGGKNKGGGGMNKEQRKSSKKGSSFK